MLRPMIETHVGKSGLDFRLWLQTEYADRLRRNSRYSLRAFGRALDMDASSISQILAGKRRVSNKLIERVCDKLGLSPELRIHLLTGIAVAPKPVDNSNLYHQIPMDAFAVISDWHHYAILELTFTQNFDSSPAWIAKKLCISPTETKAAIERLERLDLIEVVDGKLRKTQAFITNFSDGFTGSALKNLQRQLLQKALDAIDEADPSEKDITSMTMSINPAKLPEARKLIQNFRRELCAFLEDGPRSRVYNLGVQLFPLSRSTLPKLESSHD